MPTKPSQSYLICTAPRSGSTLLADALSSTGRVGHPDEFFDIYDYNEQFWIDTLGISNHAEYLSKVIAAGTTENGVFGLKLFWHQSPAFLAKLKAALPDLANGATDLSHPLLSAALETPVQYIWLRRRNKLAQAISYYRASRTGVWRATDNNQADVEAAKEPEFDFEQITECFQAVHQFDVSWQQFFRQNRVKTKVLMVIYEKFVSNYEGTVQRIFDFLGIARDGVSIAPPELLRQADRRSSEWEQRFIAIAEDRHRAAEQHPAPAIAREAQPTAPQSKRRGNPRALAAERADPARLLIAYPLSTDPAPLVRAQRERDWMEATPVRFAYRCLPMVIANQAGWFILNRRKIAVTWSGGLEPAALKIDFLSGAEPQNAVSYFGSGILTFMIPYIFRTPPGFNLYVRGPANAPKDGIAALEGIVESDWTEATFTMNWKVTRPNHPLVFEEGEPIAMVSPLRRGEIEGFQPELHDLAGNPELEALHAEWSSSRAQHNADLHIPDSQARKDGWQRHYFQGKSIRRESAREHQTKLVLNEFADKRR